MKTLLMWWICGVFVLVLSVWVGVGVLTYKAATVAVEQDWSGGIKPVIERLWCGKPGCLSSSEH
jgi:hypothetical protein